MSVWLPQATTSAPEVDYLLIAPVLCSGVILVLVFGLILRYLFKYHAWSTVDRGAPSSKTWRFEITWTVATLVIFFGLFVWGADLYVRLFQPPRNALRIYVVGKQWMWKVEHPGGQREINALHVPIARPVELVMTSEDVIHDFSVPAFRIKHDVLPGRYETLWFEATQARHISLVLHAVLRHGARPNDWRNRGDARSRLSELAGAEWCRRNDGERRPDAVHALWMQRLSWWKWRGRKPIQ